MSICKEKVKNAVLIQEIRVVWTKASRGGAPATLRNAVPEALRLPQEVLQTEIVGGVHHQVCFYERDGFTPSAESLTADLSKFSLRVGCVTMHRTDTGIRCTFAYSSTFAGAPDRGWIKKTLPVEENRWVQILWNGRFCTAEGGQWWYEKRVVNVGVFSLPLSRTSQFTAGEPEERFSALAHLF